MPNNTPQDLIDRFEKSFPDLPQARSVGEPIERKWLSSARVRDIIEFIRSEITISKQQARQEAIEECKVAIKEYLIREHIHFDSCGDADIHFQFENGRPYVDSLELEESLDRILRPALNRLQVNQSK